MEATIIQFPEHKIVRMNANNQESLEQQFERKQVVMFADNLVKQIGIQLMSDLETTGIDITNPNFIRDYLFAIDCLRAAVYRNYEIPHNLHEYVEKHVKLEKLSDLNDFIANGPMTNPEA